MDEIAEIKARLPIEELVRQYAQLHKKGRNYVALCPFHQDKSPSLLVSPDKGLAYCFPCQKGGDIFSFYQLVENVDFPQAVRELAEKVGVKIDSAQMRPEKADEKERLRQCLEAAAAVFRRNLTLSDESRDYLTKRGVTPEEMETYELGLASDAQANLYDELLKSGFSRKEIVTAGLAIQRDLGDQRAFDRFRGRLMFPIRDVQSRLIGFGGRTMRNDDAKYMNTTDSPLYRKSSVLYGMPYAREAIRETKRVVVVEGYFDVLACHRAGVQNTVATCGTALTEEHAKVLKRYADVVALCLDGDRAGRQAAERAFVVLAKEELRVELVTLPDKDPADTVLENSALLKELLTTGAKPYLDAVLDDVRRCDPKSAAGRHEALVRLASLYEALPKITDRFVFLTAASPVMGIAESDLERDIRQYLTPVSTSAARGAADLASSKQVFASAEIALGLFLLYPRHLGFLPELIAPEEGMAAELYVALKTTPYVGGNILDILEIGGQVRERALLLQLYCEEMGFGHWGDSLAAKEIRRNCQYANREIIRRKQQDILRRLTDARRTGAGEEKQRLESEYQELLKASRPVA